MRAIATFLIILLLGATAWASDRINYPYDARGRLVTGNDAGRVNNNFVTTYAYDRFNNRSTKTITGAAGPPCP